VVVGDEGLEEPGPDVVDALDELAAPGLEPVGDTAEALDVAETVDGGLEGAGVGEDAEQAAPLLGLLALGEFADGGAVERQPVRRPLVVDPCGAGG
jgi:hypothetical protein